MNSEIIIGSRGSDLALWQANFVKASLEELGHSVRIEIIKTQGDKIQHLSFDKMEGKGFFTKEIEEALLDKRIDLAVHSCKDLETNQPDGLIIAANSSRANPADILLIKPEAFDPDQKWYLKQNAVVGTSSARRKVQLLHHRPDVQIEDIRGNVPTRVNKLRDGNFDAIVLAKAGLDRLQLDYSDLQYFEFDPNEFIPAPAQGVLALQVRESDLSLLDALKPMHNEDVGECIEVERKVLNLLEGGCQLPLGSYCTKSESGYVLKVAIADDLESPLHSLQFEQLHHEGLAELAIAELKKKELN